MPIDAGQNFRSNTKGIHLSVERRFPRDASDPTDFLAAAYIREDEEITSGTRAGDLAKLHVGIFKMTDMRCVLSVSTSSSYAAFSREFRPVARGSPQPLHGETVVGEKKAYKTETMFGDKNV